MWFFFVGWWGAGPSTPLPTWKTSVSLFVWVLSFDLSWKGGPTSSYTTAGIALRIISPRKPPYPAKDAFLKVEIPQGGRSKIAQNSFEVDAKREHEEDRKKNWMEGIKKIMNERNLNEGQWEDRKQWSLGVGQRRKTFWNRYIHTHRNLTSLIIYLCFINDRCRTFWGWSKKVETCRSIRRLYVIL